MDLCLGHEVNALSSVGHEKKIFEKHCFQHLEYAIETEISSKLQLHYVYLKLKTLHILGISIFQMRYITYRKRREALDDEDITLDREKKNE